MLLVYSTYLCVVTRLFTVPEIISVALQVEGVSLHFRMKGGEVAGESNLKWFPIESSESMLWRKKQC